MKREHDRRRLREAFYRSFDSGRLLHAARQLARSGGMPGFSAVGAGMHFRCYAEAENRDRSGLRLVVKIASAEFLAEVGSASVWGEALSLAAGLDLVPPFEILRLSGTDSFEDQGLAVVMPFGPDAPDRCAAWWQPGPALIHEFYRDIGRLNLCLGDVPQIRCWDGIPFIYDFSDLRRSESRG